MTSDDHPRVLLVCMPFQSVQFPSLGLGLLQAVLRDEGMTCDVRYASLDYAKEIGFDLFQLVAVTYPTVLDMVGDWIFSAALFDEDPDPAHRLLERVRSSTPEVVGLVEEDVETFCEGVAGARATAGVFLDRLLTDLRLDRYDLVGFTDVYMQQTAALALARRIRVRHPHLPIVLGGPNVEDAMGRELVRRFDFVDVVVDGEGEAVLPELVRRLAAGLPIDDLDRVVTRGGLASGDVAPRPVEPPPPHLADLDRLPLPAYDDFFTQFDAAEVPPEYPPVLMVETSRGCWWNVRSRCAFCGLNGRYLQFRSKSVEVAVEQLRRLVERHGGHGIALADNNQTPAFLRDFGAGLRDLAPEAPVYLGIRPTLGRAQLRDMGRLKATRFIVGVESLSSDALRFVGKGTTAARNVRFLRTARELGLRIEWNLLWGFPEEDREAYDRLVPRLPLLHHLTPPFRAVPVQLHRFSPMVERADELELAPLTPAPAYRDVYPFPDEVLANLAYYFAFPDPHVQGFAAIGESLLAATRRWRSEHAGASLLWFGGGEAGHMLVDSRPVARREVTPLSPDAASILDHCRRERPIDQVVSALAGAGPRAPIRDALRILLDDGFLVELDGLVISLPLDLRKRADG